MKYRLKNRNWFVCLGMRWLLAGFFCTGLTGCADRSAEFLMEASGGQETEESGDSSSKEQKISETEAAEVKKETKTEEAQTEEKEKTQTADSADDTGINNTEPQNLEPQKIFVDVCGAVSQPGVFELAAGSRVFQAIEAAGGYLPEAAQSYVNRAQGLEDGQQIYVPTLAELEEQEISEHTLSPAQEAQPNTQSNGQTGQDVPEGSSEKVNLNTADETQLTTLGGIGPSKAQAIIAYRQENGPFQAIEEIMNVQGIKEGTFAGIKDKIEVG